MAAYHQQIQTEWRLHTRIYERILSTVDGIPAIRVQADLKSRYADDSALVCR